MSLPPCDTPLSDVSLLAYLDIDTPLAAIHQHLELAQCPHCLERLDALARQRDEPLWAPPRPVERIPSFAPSDHPESMGRLGTYEILRPLGEGGMGIVYEARQAITGRLVAVKIPFPTGEPGFEERFLQEGRAQARIQNPRLATIHEVVPTSEVFPRPYLVMERLEGETLAERLQRDKSISHSEACRIVREVALGLAAAHQAGVIHRDIKPSNIFLTTDGSVKLMDFGLARSITDPGHRTRTGLIAGTPCYMSPEQFEAKDSIGPCTDVYSAGVVLYEALTGRLPFLAESPLATMQQVLNADPVSPRRLNPSIPQDVETLCLKCLEKEPSRRYPSAETLANRLGLILENKPIPERPLSALGHASRWAWREPVKAVLIGLLAFALVALTGVSGSFALWYRSQAEKEREQAEKERDLRQEIEKSLKEERLQGYYQRIGLAASQLEKGNLGAAEKLLEECDPEFRNLEWRLLKRRLRPQLADLTSHRDGALGVVFHPQGKHVASCGSDGLVQVCDAESGERIWQRNLKAGLLWAIAYHPEGRLLAVAGKEGKVHLVNAETGAPVGTLTYGAVLRSLAFRPDGKHLATGGDGGEVRIWEVQTGRLLRILPFHGHEVSYLVYHHNGTQLAIGTSRGPANPRLTDKRTGQVSLWDGEALRKQHEFQVSDPVSGLVYAPDGRTLMAADTGGHLNIWETESGKLRNVIPEKLLPTALAFSRRGRLALSTKKNAIRLLDLARTPQEFREIGAHTDHIHALAFNPDGTRLASAGLDGAVRIWDATVGTGISVRSFLKVMRLEGPIGIERPIILGATFDPSNNDRLIIPRYTAGVPVFSAATGKETATLPGVPLGMRSGFANKGRTMVVLGGEGDVSLYDGPTLKEGSAYRVGQNEKDRFLTGAISPSTPHAALGGTSRVIRLIDLETGETRSLEGHTDNIRALAFHPDGTLLASGGWDKTVRIWELPSGRLLHTLKGHEEIVSCLAFSEEGHYLASGSGDKTIRLWDAKTGTAIRTLEGQDSEVRGVTFSPGGRLLSCGSDRDVRIWDPKRGQLIHTMEKSLFPLHSVLVSPDERYLLAGSEGAVMLWSLESPAQVDQRPK